MKGLFEKLDLYNRAAAIFITVTLSSIVQAVPMCSQREISCIYCHTRPNAKKLNDTGLLYGHNSHYPLSIQAKDFTAIS